MCTCSVCPLYERTVNSIADCAVLLSPSCLCRCSDETGSDGVDEHSGALIPLVLTTDEPTKRPSLSVEHCSFLDSVISSQTGLPTIGSTPSACYSAANAAESFRLI